MAGVLVTPRLILRPAREDDLDDIFALLSHPLYMRYWSSLPHQNVDETREWLAGMMATTPDEGCDFIVECEGRAIGKAGVYRWPEIGYGLHPDYWGRGLAREAVAAVIPHVFAMRPELTELTANADPRNEASIRLLESFGFVKTGHGIKDFQVGEDWLDSAYFALTRR